MWQIFRPSKQWTDWVTLSAELWIYKRSENNLKIWIWVLYSQHDFLILQGEWERVWVYESMTMNTHECTHAKWGFRESTFTESLKEDWAGRAAGPLLDVWSRLWASRRESGLGRFQGQKQGCYRGGVRVFGEEGFCSTSTVLFTLCCNLWLYMADYHTRLSRHTVDFKWSWFSIGLILKRRLGPRRKEELWGRCTVGTGL